MGEPRARSLSLSLSLSLSRPSLSVGVCQRTVRCAVTYSSFALLLSGEAAMAAELLCAALRDATYSVQQRCKQLVCIQLVYTAKYTVGVFSVP